jgi:hypothetical protein
VIEGRTFVSKRSGSLLLVALFAAAAYAQYNEGWYMPTYSSTAEEGIQRGYADIVRSQGMANLMNSKAAKEYELARREYIQNRLQATQTYFEMRRTNEEARKAKRSSPLSFEQYVRLAKEEAPDALPTSQLDPLTGYIRWPAPLTKPEYAAMRKTIDKLFQDRAGGYVAYGSIQAACQDFAKQLQADLQKFPPNEYIAAKKFIESLAHAARTLPG